MPKSENENFPPAVDFGCGLAFVLFAAGVSLALVVKVWTWIN